MAVYKVKHTTKTKTAISINETEIDNSTAIKLFGRRRLAYGQDLNENLLRLLESFSCPRSMSSSLPVPDTEKASDNMFDNPVEGQLWYDSTPLYETLYVFDGTKWVEQRKFGEIAANWGIIADGAQIPLPISPSGRTYTYAECSWIVSPYGYPNTIDFMNCRADSNAVVTMQYSLENDAGMTSGYANYLIVGIPGNVNLGAVTPGASVTPTPTVTATPTPTRANTPTPTTSISNTPTPTPTREATQTPTPSPSVGTSMTPTPLVSVTPSAGSYGPFGVELFQGDGLQYGDGLVLSASNLTCDGYCGNGLGFAPTPTDVSFELGIKVTGGIAPLTVIVDTWSVDPSSPNTMFNEYLMPAGNFSGDQLEGNPLNNPTWTWTGGADEDGMLHLSAVGKCAFNDRIVTGSAVVRCKDSVGREVSQSFGWSLSRSAASGDNTECDAVIS